jgi:hypothetical protein
LTWTLRGARRRRAEADLRALFIAAAAEVGGEAVKKLAARLENEMRDLQTRLEPEQSRSETPLSQAEFEAWLKGA